MWCLKNIKVSLKAIKQVQWIMCTMHMSHQFEMPLEEYVYKRYTNFAQMTSAKVGQKKIEIMQ